MGIEIMAHWTDQNFGRFFYKQMIFQNYLHFIIIYYLWQFR